MEPLSIEQARTKLASIYNRLNEVAYNDNIYTANMHNPTPLAPKVGVLAEKKMHIGMAYEELLKEVAIGVVQNFALTADPGTELKTLHAKLLGRLHLDQLTAGGFLNNYGTRSRAGDIADRFGRLSEKRSAYVDVLRDVETTAPGDLNTWRAITNGL